MIIAIYLDIWSMIVILHAKCNVEFGLVIRVTSIMFVWLLSNVEQYWTVQLLWQQNFNHSGMIRERIVKINISHLCAFYFIFCVLLILTTFV